MIKILYLALKNLLRYKRRTLLTGLLIAVGMVAVIVFVGLSGSFKKAVVAQITDSLISHMQVHAMGYTSSIDNLPLDRMISFEAYEKLLTALAKIQGITAFSPRIKFGAMLSNYAQTTNVRLNGIDPEKENSAVPLLASRIRESAGTHVLLKPGEVLLPEILAKGMDVKTGDTVVLVANNKEGSVNGMTFKVAGLVESLMGPGGRDGYLHINDAATLLRIEKKEISEIAIRVSDFDQLSVLAENLGTLLVSFKNKQGKPVFELHTWEQLSPFFNIVRMMAVMNMGIRVILVSVVLISVLNVMMMSVYERVREIGTLAAMGTKPGRIMGLFVAEGFSLGLVSALAGAGIGVGALWILDLRGVEVAFGGPSQIFILDPSVSPAEVISSCLIVVAVSILASLQPAAKAARLAPVDALRHI